MIFIKLSSKSLRNISISNRVFITLQMLAMIMGIAATICTDNPDAIAIFLFAPTVAYILYNIIVQNLVDFGYMYKEYSDTINYTFSGIFAELRITKKAKKANDKLGFRLKLQMYTSTAIALLNIVIQIILIYIYHPDMIG